MCCSTSRQVRDNPSSPIESTQSQLCMAALARPNGLTADFSFFHVSYTFGPLNSWIALMFGPASVFIVGAEIQSTYTRFLFTHSNFQIIFDFLHLPCRYGKTSSFVKKILDVLQARDH